MKTDTEGSRFDKVNQLMMRLADLPEVRRELVIPLWKRIHSGTYEVNAHRLARALFEQK